MEQSRERKKKNPVCPDIDKNRLGINHKRTEAGEQKKGGLFVASLNMPARPPGSPKTSLEYH